MFKISSETELKKAFRPRDLKVFDLPVGVTWPLVVRGSFSWVEPAGVRAYTLFQDPGTGRALGLVFRRDGQQPKDPTGCMCEWCHQVGTLDRVGLLTCEKSSKRRIGTWLCRDLQCCERAEDLAFRSGRNAQHARQQVLDRMWRFAHEGLGIEAVPPP
jgi:hypothetical protein